MKSRKEPKVLLVSPYSSKTVGGIGTWSKIVLDYSQEQEDCKVSFLNTVQGLPKRWALNYKLAHILIGILDSVLIIIRLILRMFFTRPDVVHYTSSAASALYKDKIAIGIVKGLFKKKFVIHWHFGRIPIIFEEKGKEYELFVQVCQNADISITIDARSQETLERAGIKSVYVPNPIPVALQHKAEELSIGNEEKSRNKGEVLFVGHVLETKGIIELVKACLDNKMVERLIVVGPFFDDNLKKDVISLASQRDGGKWLQLVGEKTREEVWDYYKTCSLFCLPSYTEGFPYVILEAMAFACPVVATKVGAIPEMLSRGCGSLVDAKKVEPLREAINTMLSNMREANQNGKNAHEKVLREFTIKNVFQKYSEVWNSVL